jgi:NodT family efflux transporter outer membrane factor (OMF) lipoprotein
MSRRHLKNCILFVGILGLAGCTVGPDYKAPEASIPAGWSTDVGKVEVDASTPWWKEYGDSELNKLVENAIKENSDVHRALSVIREANEMVHEASSGGAFQMDVGASAIRRRDNGTPKPSAIYSNFGPDVNVSWEIDMFGRTRRAVEGAKDAVAVSEEDSNAVRLSLISSVVKEYIGIRGIQKRIQLGNNLIASQQKTRNMIKARFKDGAGTSFEVIWAEAALSTTEALIPALQLSLAQSVHRLAVLEGSHPTAFDYLIAQPGIIPTAPLPSVGLPVDLLRRRPDVRRAERFYAVRVAEIGQAEADRYPRLALNGNFSFSGSSLAQGFTSPIFSFGPSISIPVLSGGYHKAVVSASEARADQARDDYQHTVISAMSEIEDALSSVKWEKEHADKLNIQTINNEKATKTAMALYLDGTGNFIDILDSDREINNSQTALVESEISAATDIALLYTGLGGGWSPEIKKAEPEEAPQVNLPDQDNKVVVSDAGGPR